MLIHVSSFVRSQISLEIVLANVIYTSVSGNVANLSFPKILLNQNFAKKSWHKTPFMAKHFDTSTTVTALYSLQALKSDKHTPTLF